MPVKGQVLAAGLGLEELAGSEEGDGGGVEGEAGGEVGRAVGGPRWTWTVTDRPAASVPPDGARRSRPEVLQVTGPPTACTVSEPVEPVPRSR